MERGRLGVASGWHMGRVFEMQTGCQNQLRPTTEPTRRGGRSANRGQCAQACRMPYGLLVDGQLRDLQDLKYLLSPQDLMALEQVGWLG